MDFVKKIFAYFVFVLLLCGCENFSQPPEQPTKNEVKMGIILPFAKSDNDENNEAKEFLRGFVLAVNEINQRGDSIKLSYCLANADEDSLQAQIEEMKKKGVQIFNVGLTNFVVKNFDFLCGQNDLSILINYFCEYAPAVIHTKNSLRFCPNSINICQSLEQIALPAKDISEKLFIINSNDFFGKSGARALNFQLEDKGYKIVNIPYQVEDRRFEILARYAMELCPKYIFFYGHSGALDSLLIELKRAGFNGKIVANTDIQKGKSDFHANFYYIKTQLEKNSRTEKFFKQYENTFNETPTRFAAYAYDSTIKIFDAFVRAGFDAQKARESLLNKKFSPSETVCCDALDADGDSCFKMKICGAESSNK